MHIRVLSPYGGHALSLIIMHNDYIILLFCCYGDVTKLDWFFSHAFSCCCWHLADLKFICTQIFLEEMYGILLKV